MSSNSFQVYNASAGAGKTYSLVYNFLRICLGSPTPAHFRSVLAITFTNKAAQEMKDRIIRALTAFSDYPNSGKEKGMLEDLAKELDLDPSELKKRSYQTLRTILHQYSAFSVSTIDKFTNRVIRTFAQDLKLSANYEVELDSSLILGEAIDRMLSQLEEKSPLAEIMIRFLNSQLEEGKSPRAEMHLMGVGKSLFQEEAIYPISLLQNIKAENFIKIRAKLWERNVKLEKQASQKAESALRFIEGIDHSLFNRSYLPKYLIKIAKGSFEFPSATVKQQMEGEADLYTKGKAKEASVLIDPIATNLLEACQDLQDLIHQNYAIYELSNLVIGELYSLGVLAEIERNLQEVKSESNRLPIGEFNKVISDKLKDQPAAFLYERLGDRYQHYFIDEFQDTSRLQWKNLTPLVNNAMAQGGSSMLVGDGKQAIYRWRGGEVEQFLDLNQDQDASNRVLINGKEQKLYDMQSVALANNWRSRRNIVEFNNQFFKELIHTTDKGKLKVQNSNHRMLFDESSQEVKGKAGGYVEIKHFFRDKTQADLYAEQQNQYCLSIIQDALNRGYRLSDIAILNRKKSNSSALSKFLIENGISIVSPDSLSLGDSTEIGVLLAFLQIVLRPDDNEGRLDFLEWLYKRLEDESLAEHDFLKKWCNAEPDQLFTFLSKHLDGFSIRHFLSLSLIEKIYELCFMLGFNLQQDPFLQAFMDVVVDFEVNKALGEAEFLRYWEAKASENTLALPDDLDAVRMMTIHKSKGLEFPIVILAYADWRAFSEQKSSAWIPLDEELFFGLPAAKVSLKELQDAPGLEFYQPIYQQNKENIVLDNLNLLYVALTRAVDELYILSCDGWEDNQRIQIYLKHYLQSQGQEGLDWSNGEKQQKEEDSNGAVEKRLKEYERARMREKLAVTMEAPKNWQSGESESTSWGKKVHSVLSRVQYGDDQKEVLENMLRQGNFRAEEEEKLEHFVKELVNHAELKTYFQKDKKVLNEAEILLPKGNTARPDRLVQDGAKYHIIDYKTGKPAEHHKIQLDGYADILHQMGFEVGDKVLIYLQEGLSIEKW